MKKFELKTGNYYSRRLYEEFRASRDRRLGAAIVLFFIIDEIRNPDRLLEVLLGCGLLLAVWDFIKSMHQSSDDTSVSISAYARKQLFPDTCYHLGVYTREQYILYRTRWVQLTLAEPGAKIAQMCWIVWKG